MNIQAFTLPTHNNWSCLQVTANDFEARTPVHLCCVIDTSASMAYDNKLENVKKSLQFLIDFLAPQDSISIITFSETAHTILSQTVISATEKDNIRTRISIIRIDSNTNISAGLIQARDSLYTDTHTIKQGILLLTDGVANIGLTRPNDIVELVTNTIHTFNNTSISSIGYGTEHNVELLQQISTEGGGSYYVVNNLEDVANVFGDILGGLVSCAAQQVRVILPSGTEIKSRYATNIINNQMEILIGDLVTGTEAVFLAKIPIGHPVTLKGYDLTTHNTIEINTTVSNTDDTVLQVNGEAHYIRFEVLTILEQSRNLINCNQIPILSNQINKINECITLITSYQSLHENPLWDILIDELHLCKSTLQNRHNNRETYHIMSQRADYIGRMRGIPASLSASQPVLDNDPIITSAQRRTFSNNVQRQISSQLYATLSNPIDLIDPIDPIDHINHSMPILHRSPDIYAMNMPEISELETLLLPTEPLTREYVCS